MSSKALHRTRLDVPLVAGLVATAAGLLGIFTVVNASAALAAIAAAVFAAITLWRPFLGVLLLVAAIPLENMFILAEGVTALKAAGVAVFALWALRKFATGESWRHLAENGFVYAALAFILLAFLSLIWAENVRVAQRGAFQLIMLFAFSLLLLDLVRSWDRADLLIRVLVASGLIAAWLTIQQSFAGANRAGEMIAGGVNATAVVLVSLIPLAFYLLRGSKSNFWRLAGVAYIGSGCIAVTMTYSRMNLLLLPPLLLILFWQSFRDGRNRLWLFLFLIGGSIGAATTVSWDRLAQRAETIVPYLQSSIAAGETVPEQYSGRGYHARVGLEIARNHPVLGVGYRNYGSYFREEYQYIVGGTTRVYRSDRSAHSTYIGILADLGAVGILLWLFLIGVVVRRGWQAWALVRHARGSPPLVLVQSVMLLLLLYVLAYGWYLANQQSKLYWLILGLAAALPTIASRAEIVLGGEKPLQERMSS